jgi:hypothetical protein
MRQQTHQSDISRFIQTNARAGEIFALFHDAVYMAQVPSLDAAVDYAKQVAYYTVGPIYLGNLTRDEARPIFNYVVKPRHA